jgi:hypothetical protein
MTPLDWMEVSLKQMDKRRIGPYEKEYLRKDVWTSP